MSIKVIGKSQVEKNIDMVIEYARRGQIYEAEEMLRPTIAEARISCSDKIGYLHYLLGMCLMAGNKYEAAAYNFRVAEDNGFACHKNLERCIYRIAQMAG